MANAPRKIILAPARPVPFNKLVLSQANVRQVQAGASIEQLAESIARCGLLQSLHVRPVLDGEGRETGMYEVPAGGRRYRALELLVGRKRLNKTVPVPCIVSDPRSDILVDEISLTENVERVSLHPLDQFRAFQAMRDKGMGEEAIAAAFFVPVSVVKQRLRLAAVSGKLLAVYAADGMTLEQLMVFTVTPDHARQEQVWEALRHGWKEPYQIRRMLIEKTVAATERRAVFVGVEAYEAAGGSVLRDLFQADQGGWLEDVVLLDRLVAERLKAEAEAVAAEGWKWVEVAVGFPYGHQTGLRHLRGEPVAMTDEERATIAALVAEQQRLESEYDTAENPDAVDERLGEIETVLDALATRPVRYDPAEVARAGAFVSIGHDGGLRLERGYVRPEDEAPVESGPRETPDAAAGEGARMPESAGEPARPTVQRAVITIGAASAVPQPEPEEDGIRPLPDRLVAELSAHRTLALREAVGDNPEVALTVLLHKLVCDTFRYRSGAGCLEAVVREVHLGLHGADLDRTAVARAVGERHAAWGQAMLQEADALWDWLAALDEPRRMALLAHCVAFGVNALHEKPNPYGGTGVSEHGLRMRLAQAERLAPETGLDMVAAGWRPTVANYLGRVTKARILEAVREGAGEDKVQLIAHLRKDEMAREAERLLAETGWLPEPLRSAGTEAAAEAAVPAEADGGPDRLEEVDALPAFLAQEDEADDPVDGDYAIAAE